MPNFIISTLLNIAPGVSKSGNKVAGIRLFLTKILNLSSNRSFFLGMQSIHQISICRKPWFPMNISFIITLIVPANLSLKWQIFVDSVNFIVHTCDIKNEQIYHYLLLKEKVKLHQLPTSSQVNFEVCLKFFSMLWLQSIHQINICSKPLFPMKVSLIFT